MAANPRVLIQQLIESGMQESEITAAICADGVTVSAATVNRIKTGFIKRTGFDIGSALLRLHARRMKQRAKRSVSREHVA